MDNQTRQPQNTSDASCVIAKLIARLAIYVVDAFSTHVSEDQFLKMDSTIEST